MKLLDLLIAIVFFAVVGLFLYFQFYGSYFVKFRYESTKGKIISSAVEQIEQEEDCGEYCTKTVTAFRPKLLYEYEIGKIKYFGTRYRAFPRGEDKLWAESIIKDLPAGKQVTVFFNPENPERSVLTAEIPEHTAEKFIFIVLLIIFSSVAFYRSYYRSNDSDEQSFYEGFKKIS